MDCVKPTSILDPTTGRYIEVPCGMCILCRIARTREWSTRLQMENSQWNESVFVTLTYDDDHIRLTPCGHPTLWKPDLQNFFKRLRAKFHEDAVIEAHLKYPDLKSSDKEFITAVAGLTRRFSYFACGEYGSDERTARSHYHAIIFGLSPSDIALFQEKWPNGFVSVGGVSPQSIQYVTGYVRKKLVKKDYSPQNMSCLHRVPEFQLQSQGLGLSFYERYKSYIADKLYLNINGHRESLPRYFLKKDVDLKKRLTACRLAFDTRSENLKRAQEILNARGMDLDLLSEMRKSAVTKARTENAKNALFKKGTI